MIPGLGRSPGEGNDNLLQYSYLENLVDRGAWQTIVHGVAKSWAWLKQINPQGSSVQFSPVRLFATPWTAARQASLYHQLPEFTQTHAHWVGDAIQPSHPLSSPSPPALTLSQHQGLFKWVNSSHQVAKVLEFQLQQPTRKNRIENKIFSIIKEYWYYLHKLRQQNYSTLVYPCIFVVTYMQHPQYKVEEQLSPSSS